MSYIALYRKYRPLDFNSVVGQEHIVNILKNQIINNKVAHAYIFSGSRGTGKTSTAKIFARAVNCLSPIEGNPCNECEACKSILSGETTDVVEMDAASNNSVENIRSIRQEVMYATTGLKYKIYIIDEAHMLSTSAFNALLKTLEEPPPNVIFILATTEEHKLLPTILSRCIRFEFKKITISDVIKRLQYILEDKNIKYESSAIELIAKLCDGGMRDALSILERCIEDESLEVTKRSVQKIIGISDESILQCIIDDIIDYNVENAYSDTQKILDTGKDVRYLNSELLKLFMDILIKGTDKISKIRLNYIIKELAKLDSDMRQSINSELLFKAKVIELSLNNIDIEEEDLKRKIEALELRLEKLERNGANISNHISKKDSGENIKEKIDCKQSSLDQRDSKSKTKDMEKTVFKEISKLQDKIIEKDNLQLYSALAGVKAYKENQSIIFATENNFAYKILNKEENASVLKDTLQELFDDEYTVRIEYNDSKKIDTNTFEQHMKNNDIPFVSID